jgi:hypothetical protein
MPINRFNIANDYREQINPSSDNRFLLEGTSGPVANVYVMEKSP